MRVWICLRALLAHWRRHPVELATLLVGLAVATALWSGVQALNAEARSSYARAAAVLGGDRLPSVVARDGQRFALADFVALRRAGWPVTPVLEGDLPWDGAFLRIIGIDPLTLPQEVGSLQVGDDADRLARFLTPPHLALAAPETVDRLGPAAGLPPLSVGQDLPPDTLLVDIAVAERLLDARGRISRLILPRATAGPIPPAFGARLELRETRENDDLARLSGSFHLNLSAFGFLSFIVGLIIVYSAIGLAFEQRRPMLRTLRACGVSARMLTGVMILELVALALAAGLVGVIAGYLIASALLPDVAASLAGLYGAHLSGTLRLEPAWWAAGIAGSVLGALAAGGFSLWKAASFPLLATAQPHAWLGAQRRRQRLQAALAAALGLGVLGTLLLGEGLAAGFAVMGGLLLVAALLLPVLLATVLAAGSRWARGAVWQWIWADCEQQLSGLAVALMALLIALSVNVGVGTMVDSFRHTFNGWLDQRLASEVYLTPRDASQAAEVAGWLDARPEVTARLPIVSAASRFRNWPTEIYGFQDHATYRDNWPLLAALPDAWDQVARGEALLVSEQLARRFDLTVGETIELPTAGGLWSVRVAAIYSDYGNPEGQFMVAVDELAARWPATRGQRFALRLDPAAVPGLISDVRARFNLGDGQVVDQATIKAFSTQVFEKTFAVTLALNALTLMVAGVALLTSLLTLSNLRIAQLAPVWAMGITGRQLAAIEMGKTLALAGMTALMALPLGLGIAWVLTAVINVEAFGWRLPIFLFPRQWLILLGLALGTAFVAALWPVLQLRRATPLTLLQTFSNER